MTQYFVARLPFMLFNMQMVYPLCMAMLATLAALSFRRLRNSLRERWALILFWAVPALWAALVPWSALFLTWDRGANAEWASWPIYAVVFGWPVVAAALVVLSRGSRDVSAMFVLLNIPGWLLACFASGMAVSGDWF